MKKLALLLILSIFLFTSCDKQEYKKIYYKVEHNGYGEVNFKMNFDMPAKILSNGIFDTTLLVPIVKNYTYQFKVDYNFSTEDNISTNVNIFLYSDDVLEDYASYLLDSKHNISGTIKFVY